MNHFFASKHIMEAKCGESTTQSCIFPLYLYPANEEEGQQKQLFEISSWPPGQDVRVPNLNPEFVTNLENKLGLQFVTEGNGDWQTTFGPEDIFHYAYAVFHSPTYRQRYAEFLKIDFPRLPLTSDRGLFKDLAEKGEKLVALHLMQAPALDQLITKFDVPGSNQVERVRYAEPHRDGQGGQVPGRAYINQTQYFEGIEPKVWEFQIGGYQVLNKWLKDRKGRKLSFDDIIHYQKIVVALKETMRLMQEIDALIPSWPIE
jgi:predicted helicase